MTITDAFVNGEFVTTYSQPCDTLTAYRQFSSRLVTRRRVFLLGFTDVTPEHGNPKFALTADAARAAAKTLGSASDSHARL